MSDEQPQRPTTGDCDAWRGYWQALGLPWRTEPEIDEVRQRFLAERRAVKPDIERGIYPFRDVNGGISLARPDMEWLLATHESGGMCGPVDWSDEEQRVHEGLDLRSADLKRTDLTGLPLARLREGLALTQLHSSSPVQRDLAATNLNAVVLIRSTPGRSGSRPRADGARRAHFILHAGI